jgi:hypothetical protein
VHALQGVAGQRYKLGSPELSELIEPDLLEQLNEDVELLEVGGSHMCFGFCRRLAPGVHQSLACLQ